MYKNKSILAIVPARGGSKGVERKNIRLVAGKPLIAWTIEEAQKSKYIDRLILSSDDKDIISIAGQFNCEAPFVRPAQLASDSANAIGLVLHAVSCLNEKFDYVALLQPTSPLRIARDIDSCIKKCISTNSPTCVTVTLAEKSPYWMYSFDKNNRLRPIINQKSPVLLRQKLNPVYALNGAVYVINIDWFKKNRRFISNMTTAYVMPNTRSIDIDTEWDLKLCAMILSSNKK